MSERKFSIVLMIIGALVVSAGLSVASIGYLGQSNAYVGWKWVNQGRIKSPASLSKLSFPSLHREFFVMEGATQRNLLLGPAYVGGSVKPGENGNCVIAAHRDTHFRILKDVQKGDEISVDWTGKSFRYQITSLAIVPAEDARYYQHEGAALLTLVTCYPFYYVGPAPKRFIVRARLIESSQNTRPSGSLNTTCLAFTNSYL